MESKLDTASVGGLVLAVVSVVGTHLVEGGYMKQIISATSALIVLGGTFACALIQFSMPQVLKAIKDFMLIIRPPVVDLAGTKDTILELAKLSRRQGLLALDREAQKIDDPFLKKALLLTVDGIEPKQLSHALQSQTKSIYDFEITSSKFYEAGGGYAPTIGVLGAVLGLIHVMGYITEPDKLGAGIAVAFVATLYGVGVANLFLLPMGSRLKSLVLERMRRYEMIIEGVAAIAASENPMVIKERLAAYVLDAEAAGGGGGGGGGGGEAKEAA